ncbi:unnamed protein product [Closterium sp. Naga37s-1]|nr:unnamed protein product [Closterium sp. Naga37s-1]
MSDHRHPFRLLVPRPGQVLGLVGTNGIGKSTALKVLAGLMDRPLPVPRPGQVLGLVGTNGIGKSTALKVLAGKLKPNLGRFSVSTQPLFSLQFSRPFLLFTPILALSFLLVLILLAAPYPPPPFLPSPHSLSASPLACTPPPPFPPSQMSLLFSLSLLLSPRNPPDWQEILTYFRGSELQNYFTRILEDNLKAIIKPQYVDHIPKAVKGLVGAAIIKPQYVDHIPKAVKGLVGVVLTEKDERDAKDELSEVLELKQAVKGLVGVVLTGKDERDAKDELSEVLELKQVWEREVEHLSGGELQRFAIGVVAGQLGDIYMFDEPSSYLDVRQRLKAAQVIRSLLRPDRCDRAPPHTLLEHDLSVLRGESIPPLPHAPPHLPQTCNHHLPTRYAIVVGGWSTISVCSTISPTSSAASTASREPTGWSHCPSSLPAHAPCTHPPLPHTSPSPSAPCTHPVGRLSTLPPPRYVIVVEHDLSVLDYLSDFICCLYGKPGAYGVVTLPFSVREGINIFLAGFVPTENLRFRDESLTFRVAETPVDNPEEAKTYTRYKYPRMVKKQGGFKLTAGLLKSDPDEATGKEAANLPEFSVSYKPQKTSPKFPALLSSLPSSPPLLSRSEPLQAGLLKADPDEETGKEAEDLPEFNVSYKLQKISRKFPLSYPLADPDEETGKEAEDLPEFNVSYKPQKISRKFPLSILFPRLLSLPSPVLSASHPLQAGLLKSDLDEETGKEAEDLPEFNVSYKPQKIRSAPSSPSRAHSPSPSLPSLISHVPPITQAGLLKSDPDEETGKEAEDLPEFNVSYKPQKISPKFPHSVRALLHSKIRDSFHHPQFNTDVLRPMQIDPLLDQEVVNLSGGELQRVAITLCLGKEVVNLSGGELQRVAITLCLGKVRKGTQTGVSWVGGGGAHPSFHHPQFNTDVLCPMQIDPLLDQEVVNLSGGELQRVAITVSESYVVRANQVCPGADGGGTPPSSHHPHSLFPFLPSPACRHLPDRSSAHLDSEQRIVAAKVIKRSILHWHSPLPSAPSAPSSLSRMQPADIYLIDEPSAYLDSEQRIVAAKPADIYLIDEPSAYLDSEQRIVAAKVIKRFILHAKKTAFVVEHDFIMATYLADRVIVYEGQPSVDCTARTPQSLNSGMNLFLSQLDITFRMDPTNLRPRINKRESVKDREQKAAGTPMGAVPLEGALLDPFLTPQLDITFRRDPTNLRPRINKRESVKDREQKAAGTHGSCTLGGCTLGPLSHSRFHPCCLFCPPPPPSTPLPPPHQQLDITFRRDPTNLRPRINKRESVKDREQKAAGTHGSCTLGGCTLGPLSHSRFHPCCLFCPPPPPSTPLPSPHQQLDITFRRDPTNLRPRINKMESVKDREQKAAGTHGSFFIPVHTTVLAPARPTNFRPRINKMESVKDREQKNAGTYYYLDD